MQSDQQQAAAATTAYLTRIAQEGQPFPYPDIPDKSIQSPDGTSALLLPLRIGNPHILSLLDGTRTNLTQDPTRSSCGAWSNDSKRVAFITYNLGEIFHNKLHVYDCRTKSIIQSKDIGTVGRLLWSPSGHALLYQALPAKKACIYNIEADTIHTVAFPSNAFIDTMSAAWIDNHTIVQAASNKTDGTTLSYHSDNKQDPGPTHLVTRLPETSDMSLVGAYQYWALLRTANKYGPLRCSVYNLQTGECVVPNMMSRTVLGRPLLRSEDTTLQCFWRQNGTALLIADRIYRQYVGHAVILYDPHSQKVVRASQGSGTPHCIPGTHTLAAVNSPESIEPFKMINYSSAERHLQQPPGVPTPVLLRMREVGQKLSSQLSNKRRADNTTVAPARRKKTT